MRTDLDLRVRSPHKITHAVLEVMMRRLRQLLVGALVVGASVGTVQAEPFTYTFSGVVASFDDGLTSVFPVGTAFTGSFTYDDDLAPQSVSFNTARYCCAEFSIDIGGLVYETDSAGITIQNNVSNADVFRLDSVGTLTGPTALGLEPFFFEFMFAMTSTSVFTNTALPSSPFDGSVVLPRTNGDIVFGTFASSSTVYLETTSLELSTASVPEPSTLLLLSSGALLFAANRRRRRPTA